MSAAERELDATLWRFGAVMTKWGLGPTQVTELIGLVRDGSHLNISDDDEMIAAGPLTRDVETRMRLVIEVDALLARLVPDERLVPTWLRTENIGFYDVSLTPLRAMSTGVPALRAIRDHLRGYGEATISGIGRDRETPGPSATECDG